MAFTLEYKLTLENYQKPNSGKNLHLNFLFWINCTCYRIQWIHQCLLLDICFSKNPAKEVFFIHVCDCHVSQRYYNSYWLDYATSQTLAKIMKRNSLGNLMSVIFNFLKFTINLQLFPYIYHRKQGYKLLNSVEKF